MTTTNLINTITSNSNIYQVYEVITNLTNTITNTLTINQTAISSMPLDGWVIFGINVSVGAMATIIGVVVSGVLSCILVIVACNQFKLLKFQQLDKGKEIIHSFQQDVNSTFFALGRDIANIQINITKLCLSPQQANINDLILHIVNNDLHLFARIDREGFISFTLYVKQFKQSIFNGNEKIYSYLECLDREFNKLRNSEHEFKKTGWKGCLDNIAVLNRVELYLTNIKESARLIKSIAIHSSNILSSPNFTKNDLHRIEEEYNKLTKVTANLTGQNK